METNLSAPDLASGGRNLYHRVWQLACDYFFDPERLAAADWPALEHAFDDRIIDADTGLECAAKALSRLDESYTRLMFAEEIDAKIAAQNDAEEHITSRVVSKSGVLVGYVKIPSFASKLIVQQLKSHLESIAHSDVLVVDLLDNSGGIVDETLYSLELFVEDSDIALIDKRIPGGLEHRRIMITPSNFGVDIERTNEPLVLGRYHRETALVAGKPTVVLFNGGTASSAELFASALLAAGTNGSVTSIGRQTFGKGICQSYHELSDKATLKMSSSRFSSARGLWFGDCGQTVSNGLVPDILVDEDATNEEIVERAFNEAVLRRLPVAQAA